MRDTLTFTIDPKDAKDFDDALSFKKLDNGNYEIGIHIADVSYYLEEGTVLDDEAYQRATSVYLVDRVVPMLPEVLSNFACSLRPNEEKYTFSAILKSMKKHRSSTNGLAVPSFILTNDLLTKKRNTS
jgi:ribonuclease R